MIRFLGTLGVFIACFFAVQKSIPIVFPRGDFHGAGSSEAIGWLLNLQAGMVSIATGLAIFLLCGWPLVKLPRCASASFGASLALLCGVTAFPYDLFQMGIWSREYEWASGVAWVFGLAAPWLLLAMARIRLQKHRRSTTCEVASRDQRRISRDEQTP